MLPRVALLAGCALLLSGCGLGDLWFGGDDEDALPGERIPIMAFGQILEEDPSITGREVRLPAPHVNDSWSQVGGSASHALYHLSLGDGSKILWRSDIGEGAEGVDRSRVRRAGASDDQTGRRARRAVLRNPLSQRAGPDREARIARYLAHVLAQPGWRCRR